MNRTRSRILPAFLLLALIILQLSCGGNSGNGPEPPLPPAVSIVVTPATSTLDQLESATLAATVHNATNTTVSWSVQEANGGSVTGAGVYTAPGSAGTFHVVATSAADTSKTATCTITVRDVSITIEPTTAVVVAREAKSFTATVTGSVDKGVSYSVQETAGGTIDAAGVYTAPAQAGAYHVIATAHANSSRSAVAGITVSAPVPLITSTAPASAEEGSEYTYAVVATDPAGTAITYALDVAPTGATITGNTITWTPAADQSRRENAFRIRVDTASGGTASQDFSVTPRGTVTVKYGAYYVDMANVKTFVPQTPPDVSVLVPDDAGGYTTIAGQVSSGQAVIPSVPAGGYLLMIGTPLPVFYEESASSVDVSPTNFKRPGIVNGSYGTGITFQITGLNPFGANDFVAYESPNQNYEDMFYNLSAGLGDTSASGVLDLYTSPLPDAAQGDVEYINQMVGQQVSGTLVNVLQKSSGPLTLTIVDGSLPTVPAALSTPGAGGTIRLNVKAAQFWQNLLEGNPNATGPTGHFGVLATAPGGATANLLISDTAGVADFDLGDVGYNNPYPATWGRQFYYAVMSMVKYQLPGTSAPTSAVAIADTTTTDLPTAQDPLTLQLGAVRNVRVNGAALTSDQTGIGLTPLIAWDPPLLGVPTSYKVTVDRLYNGGAAGTKHIVAATFTMKGTSLQVPSGVLLDGNFYFLHIQATEAGTSRTATVDSFTPTVAP